MSVLDFSHLVVNIMELDTTVIQVRGKLAMEAGLNHHCVFLYIVYDTAVRVQGRWLVQELRTK